MRFAREEYSPALIAEMMPLWKAHHAEVANKFYGPLLPDLEVYFKAAQAGMLRIFTVRDWKQNLHGYQVYFVNNHQHSKEMKHAVQDILYLCPENRKGLEGYKFVKWCVSKLRPEVAVIHQRISARHDFGKLLERMGFALEDLTYSLKVEDI